MEAPRSSGRQRKQVENFTYDDDHLTGKHKASQVRTFSRFLHRQGLRAVTCECGLLAVRAESRAALCLRPLKY